MALTRALTTPIERICARLNVIRKYNTELYRQMMEALRSEQRDELSRFGLN